MVAIPLKQGLIFNAGCVFPPCFQLVTEGVSNFCKGEKVDAAGVVFIRVFHGGLGIAGVVRDGRILLYWVRFLYDSVFCCFWRGVFWIFNSQAGVVYRHQTPSGVLGWYS